MRRGFSLIETLVGVALTAFLLAGAAELMIRSAQLKTKSDILTAAAGLARDRLARLRARAFEGEEAEEGNHEEIRFDGPTGRSFRLAWVVEPRPQGLKAVSLRVTPERSSQLGVDVHFLLARSLGF